MNPNNYATLEASKRLAEAGIVLETDYFWFEDADDRWFLSPKMEHLCYRKHFSAPTMAEVWRELPDNIEYKTNNFRKTIKSCWAWGNWCNYASYQNLTIGVLPTSQCYNINPTDALIDLLIWVKSNHTIPERQGCRKSV